jgi:DNA-binding NarL/FixJ family response regulator
MAKGRAVRVGVFDENEIFRRGVAACLTEDDAVEVVARGATAEASAGFDVVVVSTRLARQRLDCPVVVCRAEHDEFVVDTGNTIAAVLARSTLTVEQLTASVLAAAAGLRVDGPGFERGAPPPALDERSVEVLRMLADGAATVEISRALSYSERTIKGLIGEIRRALGARSRAHAVARGIRGGII